MSLSDALILPKGVLFDMDGTLTEPMLDFPRIKREMGIENQPILEALAKMSGEARARAEAVLHRHEEHAAENSVLNPGCREVLAWLHHRTIPIALVTRNSSRSVQTVLQRNGLTIEVLVAREDAPHKPSPEPLFLACKRLELQPSDVWMIGDGQYDIEAARAARMKSVWVSHGEGKPFEASPWREVKDLWGLMRLLESCLNEIR